MKKLSMLFLAVLFIVYIAAPAFAAVNSINNNFTMIDGSGGLTGGTNDVVFTWDGTMKTSVAVSGQVSNATLSSVTPFYGVPWQAHDVAIYGPGTYTVYADCPAGSPGCGFGTPVTFTVGTGQLGVHMLFDWGGNVDIDVVDVWVANSAFGPSPMFTGPDGTTPPFGNAATVWSWMSSDWERDGINGYSMVDGPFAGFNANFNVNEVGTANNNLTILYSSNSLTGGTNDVVFTWNGTKKTSVAVSGQISNAVISSTCPFYGVPQTFHDVAIYGPGTYTVYTGCPVGSPGCGSGMPITFTVGTGEIGGHMLYDWMSVVNYDIVNVWQPKQVFGPSPMYTGPTCGTGNPAQVWDWMSKDIDGNGINGISMVEGCSLDCPSANFNLMGVPPIVVDPCADAATRCNDNNICTIDGCNTATGTCTHTATVPASCNDNNPCTTDTCSNNACVHTVIAVGCANNSSCNDNNPCTTDSCVNSCTCAFIPPGICINNNSTGSNFTMLDPSGKTIGGTNDVVFAWDGTRKTAVAASGQATNAYIGSTCPFQGQTWSAHDVAIYSPGTYTVYANCAAGSPGCGLGTAITFTVGANQLGVHMLFDWGTSKNIDVVDVWNSNATFAPSALWTGACGSQVATKVWDLMSSDWDGDGINGKKMVDGPFLGFNANFNLMGVNLGCPFDPQCNDNNACTNDVCSTATGVCAHTPIVCNDNNACTADSCNTATGCIHTPINCNDGNVCTSDSCNTATGCVYTPIIPCGSGDCGCISNAECPAGTACLGAGTTLCLPACSCPMCDVCAGLCCGDNNLCTIDSVSPSGCVYTPKNCDDNNACTADSCNPATGCVHTPITCNDNNLCTTDTCNTAVGCVHTPIVCNDNNACTTDTCNPMVGCVYTPIANCGECGECLSDGECPSGYACDIIDFCLPWCTCPSCMVHCAGHCVPGCNDNNACTIDTIDPVVGCIHTVRNCNDNNPCTVDSCNPATGCVHTPIICNDNNLCTIDTCNPATGCVFTPLACPFPTSCDPLDGCCPSCVMDVECNDNNACTIDTCGRSCQGCYHTPKICNDNNACTTDSCDPATGVCVFTPIVCSDNNTCTTDTCNTATGCVFTQIPIDDGNACTADGCDPVTGPVHYPVVCNDNNVCTTDTCDPAKGCVYLPIVCSDNNLCTTDICNTATGCVFTPIVCNDNNKCTTDTCNPATGACVYAAVVIDDNNKCTTDACDPATGAIMHTAVVCNDNNLCTNDTCDPAIGCVYIPIVCNDNNACTVDSCNAATGCVFTPKVCNDGNVCTTDSCNTATGACVFTPVANGTICPHDACSGGGGCTSGVCIATCICPRGSYKSATLRGTGSHYWWYEKQIMTQFTVSGSGCILRYTDSTITATPGTVLKANWKVGIGPNPTSVTWKGVSVPAKTVPYTITCPASTGTVGNLVLSNTGARHGKDTDTLTISVATN